MSSTGPRGWKVFYTVSIFLRAARAEECHTWVHLPHWTARFFVCSEVPSPEWCKDGDLPSMTGETLGLKVSFWTQNEGKKENKPQQVPSLGITLAERPLCHHSLVLNQGTQGTAPRDLMLCLRTRIVRSNYSFSLEVDFGEISFSPGDQVCFSLSHRNKWPWICEMIVRALHWPLQSSEPDCRHTGRKCVRPQSKYALCTSMYTLTFPLSHFPDPLNLNYFLIMLLVLCRYPKLFWTEERFMK